MRLFNSEGWTRIVILVAVVLLDAVCTGVMHVYVMPDAHPSVSAVFGAILTTVISIIMVCVVGWVAEGFRQDSVDSYLAMRHDVIFKHQSTARYPGEGEGKGAA